MSSCTLERINYDIDDLRRLILSYADKKKELSTKTEKHYTYKKLKLEADIQKLAIADRIDDLRRTFAGISPANARFALAISEFTELIKEDDEPKRGGKK